MRTLRHFQISGALFLALSAALGAYSPPEDTAGPLSVRIEGPAAIAQAGAPAPITVVLDNKGDAALQGTLRVQLIDGWRAEPPGAIGFHSVAGWARPIRARGGRGSRVSTMSTG